MLGEIKETMSGVIKCTVTWSDPAPRGAVISSRLGKENFVYAIIICKENRNFLIRLGASKDLRKRLHGYPIMDFIPNVFVSYHVVSEDFKKAITPILFSFFSDDRNHDKRPSYLKNREPSDCVQSELRSIEYKVERLLIEQYEKIHNIRPPGNPRRGSYRPYLKNVTVEEKGNIRVLDMDCASLAPIQLQGEQLIRLLW